MDIRLVLTASTSQVMMKSNGKSIQITNESVEEVMSDTLYGDNIRLQEVLADFMLMAVNFTPSGDQLTVTASLRKDQLGRSVHVAYLEIRMTHTEVGIPEFLLNQMFGTRAGLNNIVA